MGFVNDQSGRTKAAAFGVAICLCLVLSGFYFVSDLVKKSEEPDTSVFSMVNPNTAEIASLMRLPGIGPARAGDIVEYRRNCGRQKAFENANDLQVIKGIGPKTVEKMQPLLFFD